ncbi:MAG: putative metal-binding protein nucleic-acid binding protein [Gammaproteobacteria bacterium]|jgi:uncharacterized protein|nr:putative metal-binding protein nucleic-acid binding protein [Gammaproteobacteria bacterium]
MTKLGLPAKIDPASFARAGREFTGVLALSAMPRLAEALAHDKAEAKYKLGFKIDEEGFVVIGVRAEAALPLICQRCLQAFLYEVRLYTELSPVTDEAQVSKLPERYEAWPLSEELTISPKEILEEELLLSLPVVPMHDEADCPATKLLADSKPEKEQATHKPFAILKKLK